MLVPRSRTRVGSATLTIVLSITITRRLTHSTARVSQRRRWIRAVGSVGHGEDLTSRRSYNVVISVLRYNDVIAAVKPGGRPDGRDWTAMARTRDEQGRRILEAASGLLSEEGASALSVRRIATAAGCSTMGLYSRFGGKDGVVDELYAEGFERLIDGDEGQPADRRHRSPISAGAPPATATPRSPTPPTTW